MHVMFTSRLSMVSGAQNMVIVLNIQMFIQSDVQSPTSVRKLYCSEENFDLLQYHLQNLHESVSLYSAFPWLNTRAFTQGHHPCFLPSFTFTIYFPYLTDHSKASEYVIISLIPKQGNKIPVPLFILSTLLSDTFLTSI